MKNITADQLTVILQANGVAVAKQPAIVAQVLAAEQDIPPPLSKDEMKQIIRAYRNDGDFNGWPSWPTRAAQARIDMAGFFTAYDAMVLAQNTVEQEISKLGL